MQNPSIKIHRHLLKVAKLNFPTLHEIIRCNDIIDVQRKRKTSLFEFVAKTIINQQLSIAAANTLWSRLQALKANQQCSLAQLFIESNRTKIQACGISRIKTEALIRLGYSNQQIHGNKIKHMNYEQICDWTKNLYGCGQWTADIIAMFYLNLLDVWPENDVALKRNLNKLLPDEICHEVALEFSPYRTTFAQHIWRAGNIVVV